MSGPGNLLEAARGGDRRALARLLTAIESEAADMGPILPALFEARRGARVVGITGPPGSGKSTLVSTLTGALRRRGRRVGIIAVDPSSPYTRGAIMGDRIRMMEHSADRDVFMRSMASRGRLGGLAATTWKAVAAMDAAGYDPILVETVGAGQSEVEIAGLAETTVVVEAPEMGDEVQAIKAGLLEVADVVVVNKGDRPAAQQAARHLRAMLSTAGGRVGGAPPPVIVTTATTGEGVDRLLEAIEAHAPEARSTARSRARAADQMRNAVADLAQRRAADQPEWAASIEAVAERRTDPFTAAGRLLGTRIHHVQLSSPPGSEAASRAFWSGLLRFEELPKPAGLAARGGCWFRRGQIEIHVGVQVAFRPSLKAHPALMVDDLDAEAARLREAGLRVEWDDRVPEVRRFYAADPHGNRLEFLGLDAGLSPDGGW